MYKLGDKVILQNIIFEEYNNKEFTIIEMHKFYYKVIRDGFDPIWIFEDNILEQGE